MHGVYVAVGPELQCLVAYPDGRHLRLGPSDIGRSNLDNWICANLNGIPDGGLQQNTVSEWQCRFPQANAVLLTLLRPDCGKRAATLKHLRFFRAFAISGSFGGAAKRLGLEANQYADERHGQVKYHLKRLATILGLDREPFRGLFRDAGEGSSTKVLTDAGTALQDWLESQQAIVMELDDE